MANYYAAIAIELDSESLFRAISDRADHNGAQQSIYLSGCLLGRCQSLTLAKTGCLLPNYVVSPPWKLRLRLTSAWATVQAEVAGCKSRYAQHAPQRGRQKGLRGLRCTSTSTQMNFALTPKRLTNKQRSVASVADNLLD